MSYNNELLNELLGARNLSIMFSNSKNTAVKINKLLKKVELPDLDVKSLEDKLNELTDKAKEALGNAIKDEDITKLLNILGFNPSKKKGVIQ